MLRSMPHIQGAMSALLNRIALMSGHYYPRQSSKFSLSTSAEKLSVDCVYTALGSEIRILDFVEPDSYVAAQSELCGGYTHTAFNRMVHQFIQNLCPGVGLSSPVCGAGICSLPNIYPQMMLALSRIEGCEYIMIRNRKGRQYVVYGNPIYVENLAIYEYSLAEDTVSTAGDAQALIEEAQSYYETFPLVTPRMNHIPTTYL